MWGHGLMLVVSEHPGRHGPEVLDVRGLERIEECSADSSRGLKEIRFIYKKAVAPVGKRVPAAPHVRHVCLEADGRSESCEENAADPKYADEFGYGGLELDFVFGEMEDRVANHSVKVLIGEW